MIGEQMRASEAAGIVHDSLRHADGVAVCAYRPSLVTEVVQAEHLDIAVETTSPTIRVTRLTGG